jgi:probable HAF family extracellular repeat protein
MHNRVHNRTTEGQRAGTFVDSQSQQHGYVRNTEAGQVVGEGFVDIDKAITSFFWDPTQPNTYVTIEVPGEIGTSPTAINDSGQIAGVYLESTTRKRKGFLRGADGTFALFEIGTSTNLQVLALNDRGTIVGSSFKLGITTGYLRYSGNGRKFFGAQANGRPWSSGINDNGLVVGWFSYSNGSSDVAFSMDRNLTPEPIPVPFSNQSTRAIGVNNAGQIVGAFVDANGIPHGWLYLP